MSDFKIALLVISTACAVIGIVVAGLVMPFNIRKGRRLMVGINVVTIVLACCTLLLNIYNVLYYVSRGAS